MIVAPLSVYLQKKKILNCISLSIFSLFLSFIFYRSMIDRSISTANSWSSAVNKFQIPTQDHERINR